MHWLRVLAVVVLFLSGMGTSDAHGSSPTRILVGLNIELTGYSADQGTEQYRGIMAAHGLEPRVDVDGTSYEIELVVCDNQTRREMAAACATQLVDQGAVAVIGGFSSAMSGAAAPVMQEAGVVHISTGATHPAVTGIGDYIFRIPFTDDYQGQVLASYAYDTLGARRVAVFQQSDDDASLGLTRVFQEAFQRLGGQVLVLSVEQVAVDFSAQLEEARHFHPDVLMNTAYCPLAGPLVLQAREAGFQQPWIGGDSLDSAVCPTLAGAAFEGVQFTGFPDLAQLAPGAREPAEAVRASYEALFPDSSRFGGVSLAGSDGYRVIREAVRRALAAGHGLDDLAVFRRAVRDELASLEHFPGVTGDLTYLGGDGTPVRRGIGLFQVENVGSDGSYVRAARGSFVIEPGGVVYRESE